MFDVGFFELMLIGVVALLVVGPERLPMLARKAGMWVGRGRRFVSSVKRDIDQEIQSEEYKRLLNGEGMKNPVHDIIEDTRQQFGDIKKQTETALSPDSGKQAPDDKAGK